MKDRLAELMKGIELEQAGSMEEIDLEKGEQDEEVDEEMEKALAKFRRETDAISQAIDRINENIESVETKYEISMDESASDMDKTSASNSISRLLEQTEKTSDAVRKRLRRIAHENKQFASEYPDKVGTLRIRVNTHQGLTKRFMGSMQNFEESQERHRDHVRGALERQLRKMNPSATDSEIQQALKKGETDSIVHNSPLLAELPPEEQTRLRNGLADLQSRNNDIKKLEESIIQLHQLFVDMQILVESQGELLNNIEYNVVETKDKTGAGLQELVQARAHQKSAHKKKCCFISLLVLLLLIILIPILVKYIPRSERLENVVASIPGLGGVLNGTATASPSPQPETAAGASRIFLTA